MPDSCCLKMIWRLNCCWCSSIVKWPKLCSISVAYWNPCVQRWRSRVGSSCNSARLSLDLWTQLWVDTPQLQYTSQVQNTGRSRDPNILWSRLRSTQKSKQPKFSWDPHLMKQAQKDDNKSNQSHSTWILSLMEGLENNKAITTF